MDYSRRSYGHAGNLKAHQRFINRAIEDLSKHYSVDTYARKLFFQNKDEYKAFKILLSSYFLFEQLSVGNSEFNFLDASLTSNFNRVFPVNRKKLDPRYDVVYAALLDESSKQLPGNIHFISWNYDIQFELSLSGFLNISLQDAFYKLNVYPGP